MPLGIRIFLVYFLFVGLSGWFVMSTVMDEIRPGVRQSTEETLVDTANLLAELLRDDLRSGRLEQSRWQELFRAYGLRQPCRVMSIARAAAATGAPASGNSRVSGAHSFAHLFIVCSFFSITHGRSPGQRFCPRSSRAETPHPHNSHVDTPCTALDGQSSIRQ